jgi:hypothetical protein
MEYREIVAVTGLGGLFQLLTTKSDGAIVRNLADKTTKFISARVHNVTPIESIEIYTKDENVRLHKVLQAIKNSESNTPLIDLKQATNNDIKAYFTSIYPNLDEDRVYVSDMKKIAKWYEILKANDLLNFEVYEQMDAEEQVTESNMPEQSIVEAATEEKPVKKSRAKKSVEPTAEGEEVVKKTAKKKKTEE